MARVLRLLDESLVNFGGLKKITKIFRIVAMNEFMTQSETRISERNFRSLIDNMLEGFAYCKMHYWGGKPQDFTYIDVNPAFGTLTGLKDVLGKKVSEVIPGILESNPELLAIYGRVALTGKPEKFESYVPELGIWFSVSVYSSEQGYFVATFDNITKRKLVEQQLGELVTFNQLILEKSPYGIAVITTEGQCVMVNEPLAQSVGGTIESIKELNLLDLPSWKHYGLLDLANKAIETGQTTKNDIKGVTAFGKEVYFEASFTPVNISGKSHLILVLNNIKDRISEQNDLTKMMHQLKEKELAKTRFLAAAGHDLRQPLAAANLFIDALKFTSPTPDQNEIIQRLDQAMSTFNGLLDALLNVSRLDAGIIKPEYTSINVSELIIWLEQSFAPMAREKQLGFRLFFPHDISLAVRGDIGLLKSVLMNLVSNAIKFTAEGAVLVSARRRGEHVLFQVWDTGIGIKAEYLDQIFDEFYQISNSQRDRTRGLGLGLSIAKRALSLIDGEITCHSQVGRGSVFEFCLPLDYTSSDVPQQDAATNSQEEINKAAFIHGKRFIVLEDDALVAEALSKTLAGMGGQVKFFHRAEVALNHPQIDDADYYIVDYMLGGSLNGIQFLTQLRQRLGRRINAVVMTGDTSTNFVRDAEIFDWPVLYKPVNISKLIASLSTQGNKPAQH